MEDRLICPKCNEKRIRTEKLISSPAKYDCFCTNCDFELPSFKRKDSTEIITQSELNNFYDKK